MPSIDDVFNQLKEMNQHLSTIAQTDQQLLNAVTSGFSATETALQQLTTIETYVAQALFQNAQQNDTIICELQKIAQRVCTLVNEADRQTHLQHTIARSAEHTWELLRRRFAAAALQLEDIDALKRRLEECCESKEHKPPPCVDTPCAKPSPIGPPPVGTPPIG